MFVFRGYFLFNIKKEVIINFNRNFIFDLIKSVTNKKQYEKDLFIFEDLLQLSF